MVKMTKKSAMGGLLNQLKTVLFGNQCCARPCCMRPRCIVLTERYDNKGSFAFNVYSYSHFIYHPSTNAYNFYI